MPTSQKRKGATKGELPGRGRARGNKAALGTRSREILRGTQTRARNPVAQRPALLRMKDLASETGVPRETIHFYIACGLLPSGKKTSRTTAVYTREHVERLSWIRRLREEHYLPLRAVKALLTDEAGDTLTIKQRLFLRRAETALASVFRNADDVPLASVRKKALNSRDLRVLEESRLIEIKRRGRRQLVSPADAEIIEVFASLREAGFTRESGYTGAEMVIFERAMAGLVADEFRMASARLGDRPANTLTSILERANPFLEHLMVLMRRKQLQRVVRSGAGT